MPVWRWPSARWGVSPGDRATGGARVHSDSKTSPSLILANTGLCDPHDAWDHATRSCLQTVHCKG